MNSKRYAGAGFAMLLAAGLALALTPSHKMADTKSRVDLERMIPYRFGDWRIDTSIAPLSVDPALQASLNKIYNQTLSRTYVNARGERIMLSVAYGGDQRSDMQVHRPEVCYPAQGFQIVSNNPHTLDTQFGPIAVRRLETRAAQRWEPVTYWVTIGDAVVSNLMQRKLLALSYGLSGTIPDGLLFRISSLERDSTKGYDAHLTFVSDLLRNVEPDTRRRLAGL